MSTSSKGEEHNGERQELDYRGEFLEHTRRGHVSPLPPRRRAFIPPFPSSNSVGSAGAAAHLCSQQQMGKWLQLPSKSHVAVLPSPPLRTRARKTRSWVAIEMLTQLTVPGSLPAEPEPSHHPSTPAGAAPSAAGAGAGRLRGNPARNHLQSKGWHGLL